MWLRIGSQAHYRLWQLNSRLRRTVPLLFAEKILKTVCVDSIYFKEALETGAPRLFKTFLDDMSNDLVAFPKL